MNGKEQFEYFQTLIEMSPTSKKRVLETIMQDVIFYDAFLFDPDYYLSICNDISNNNEKISLDPKSPAGHIKLFEKYGEKDLYTIFEYFTVMLHASDNRERSNTLLNTLFGAINKKVDKFATLYEYVSNTGYKVCRNDNFESISYVLEAGTCHALEVSQLIYNEFIDPDQFKLLGETYKHIQTNNWRDFEKNTEITTRALRKIIIATQNHFSTSLRSSEVISCIYNSVELPTLLEYINDYVIPNDTRYYYAPTNEILSLLERRPDMLKACADNAWIRDEIGKIKDISKMYGFIVIDDGKSKISQELIARYNSKNSKIYVDLNKRAEDIIKYIKLFGRRTNVIGSNTTDAAENAVLFKMCTANGIKLSISSDMFEDKHETYYSAVNTPNKYYTEFLSKVNELCPTYGVNSRIIVEFANAHNLSIDVIEDKIDDEDLRHRHHKYLLKGVL